MFGHFNMSKFDNFCNVLKVNKWPEVNKLPEDNNNSFISYVEEKNISYVERKNEKYNNFATNYCCEKILRSSEEKDHLRHFEIGIKIKTNNLEIYGDVSDIKEVVDEENGYSYVRCRLFDNIQGLRDGVKKLLQPPSTQSAAASSKCCNII